MNISLSRYNDISWQNFDQVSLSNDGSRTLQDASRSNVNGLKRFFNTEASKALNREVLSDFKAKLTANYGSLITDKVFEQCIGSNALSKGIKLSSAKIGSALRYADDLAKGKVEHLKWLRCQFKGAMSLGFDSISFKAESLKFDFMNSDVKYSPEQRMCIRAFASKHANFNALMSEVPTDTMALQDFEKRANKLITELSSLHLDRLFKNDAKGKTLVSECTRMVEMLKAKTEEAKEVCKNNPLSYEALSNVSKKFVKSAETVFKNLTAEQVTGSKGKVFSAVSATQDFAEQNGIFDMLRARCEGKKIEFKQSYPIGNTGKSISGADMKKLLDSFMADVPDEIRNKKDWQLSQCENPKTRLNKKIGAQVSEFLGKLTGAVASATGILKAWSVTHDKFFTDKLVKKVNEGFKDVIDSEEWAVVDKKLSFVCNGVAYKANSTITPGSKMKGTVGEGYRNGIYNDTNALVRPPTNGVMCHRYDEKYHAVNLAHTSFSVQGPGDDKPKEVFSGIRHGAHSAVYLKGEERWNANLNRAKESVKAAFTCNPKLMELAKNYKDGDGPINFMMTSISLMTPDIFRKKKESNEEMMLYDQSNAYNALMAPDQEITIDIDGKQVPIKPQIIMFSYGVNDYSVGKLSGIAGGWGMSNALNKQSFGNMERLVNQYLTEHRNLSEYEKNTISTLWSQIKSMNEQGTASKDNGDNYKVAARLAVLSYMLGAVPCWNCKSGKDRTGLMDVECKALATLIALKQPLPGIDGTISDDHSRLVKELSLNGGNHEIQKYNVGIAGFKVDTPSAKKRLGGKDQDYQFFQGGSNFIKA